MGNKRKQNGRGSSRTANFADFQGIILRILLQNQARIQDFEMGG